MLFPARTGTTRYPRVAVTGVGIVTALGTGWTSNFEGFRRGRTAFRPVTLFDVTGQRVKFAAEADLPDGLPETRLSPRHRKRLERGGRMLLWAADEAWRQAGWTANGSLPVVLGTTSGGMTLGQDYYRQAIHTPYNHARQALRVINYQCQRQALDLADAFGFEGALIVIANACASGANAVGHAWDLVRRGHAGRVLTGGYDALSHLVFSGFDSLQALSPIACRPFDANRDGLALGEGAAVLALETFESARKRNAEILGEVAGYGAATDCHHLTQPHPRGIAALAAMSAAAESAGLQPQQIQYINAHGTGTPLNDSAEAEAISDWAGSHAATLRVSSTKAGIGHTLGAAGAIETIVCLMALRGQWLPPSPAVRTPDPACRFSIVREPADTPIEYAMTNSFGFGGANASLILRRVRE